MGVHTQSFIMPKYICSTKKVQIPDGVKVEVKARFVKVTGPRGTLTRNFKHLNLEIRKEKSEVLVSLWWGRRRELAQVRTCCSHIENLITGVTKGYEYKMRFVYAHFPVNVTVDNTKKVVEVRNFLGEKVVRTISLPEGVTATRSEQVKDELVLVGNDVQVVSQTAADVQQSCLVKKKDIRKFLDGIYVSSKRAIEQD